MWKFLTDWRTLVAAFVIGAGISMCTMSTAQSHEDPQSEIGRGIKLGGWCDSIESYDQLYARAFRPGLVQEYLRIVKSDRTVKCFDTRAHNQAPFRAVVVEYVDTRRMDDGDDISLYKVVAKNAKGEVVEIYTWHFEVTEADPAVYKGKEFPA